MRKKINNFNDIDPISCEPIKNIKCLWYYKFDNKVFGYDALAWLEWLCHTDTYVHPVFKNDFTQKDSYNVYTEVKNHTFDNENDVKKANNLLNICHSHQLNKKVDLSNKQLNFISKSPIYNYKIISYNTNFQNKNIITDKNIKCNFIIKYKLIDYYGVESQVKTSYFSI